MICKVCENGKLASFADSWFEDAFECKGCGNMYGNAVPRKNKVQHNLLTKAERHRVSVNEGKARARGF